MPASTRPTKPVALPTHHLQGDPADSLFPTFSPDGSLLAGASSQFNIASLYIWDMKTSQRTTVTSGPGAHVVAFSPGNERIAIANEEEIQVFGWPSGQRIAQIPFKRSDPDYLGLSLGFVNADRLWVLYEPKGVWLWDLSSGEFKLH